MLRRGMLDHFMHMIPEGVFVELAEILKKFQISSVFDFCRKTCGEMQKWSAKTGAIRKEGMRILSKNLLKKQNEIIRKIVDRSALVGLR